MKHWFTPESFHYLAINLAEYKWRLLAWSAGAFLLFMLLETQIGNTTPASLVWLALAILFLALQLLVFGAFIFFFQVLPSTKTDNQQWFQFYRSIEWCETLLFALLLPLPTISYLYALIR